MASQTLRITVSMTIADENFVAFEKIAEAMLSGSRSEPGTLGYDWCLSSDRRQCRLLETYVNANAALAHLTGPVVQKYVPELLALASISSVEVYGERGSEVSAILAGFGATVFTLRHRL